MVPTHPYATFSCEVAGPKTSGQRSCRDMPVRRSTAIARLGGTCVHCDNAPEVMPSAAASLPRLPRCSFSHERSRSMAEFISTTNFIGQAKY